MKVLLYRYIVQTRVSKGRDVPRDVQGQTGTGRPVVPLSRDKKIFLSRCPFVPGQGQEQMSQDVLGQNELKNFKKMTRFPVFGLHFPVLEHPFPVLEQCFLF